MPTIDPDEFKAKVERILSAVFGGLHRIPNKIKWAVNASFQMAEILIPGDLATWDFSNLTVLVLAAHEEAIRVSLSACNFRYMRLMMHPRLREGCISQRHPTIDEAVAMFRRGKSGVR